MKRVRFETPCKNFLRMDESECQSPRPFVETREVTQAPDMYQYERVVYSNDPVHRYEYSDASPYPLAKKTVLPAISDTGPGCLPSNDLNLSMLDIHEPRPLCRSAFRPPENRLPELKEKMQIQPKVLSPIENPVTPPNVLCKDDSFFLKRDNLNRYQSNLNPLHKQLHRLSLDKENNPVHKEAEMRRKSVPSLAPSFPERQYIQPVAQDVVGATDCRCHHCIKVQNIPHCTKPQPMKLHCENIAPLKPNISPRLSCNCQHQIVTCFHCEQHVQNVPKPCTCSHNSPPKLPQNAVDKKTWAIEKLEQNKKSECMDVEKQTNISKEKREPTIADLVKIIKLQNEQLQLLQEKVDKFITTSNQAKIQSIPVHNYMTEQVALQAVDSEHKISIGVMTSFEMVRTSTVINKEILKQTKDNAHIQCNRSQISIKEVVSTQPVKNFLDGIMPVAKTPNSRTDVVSSNESLHKEDLGSNNGNLQQTGVTIDDKTLNELSLYNVQVDNATTPLISPEQSLYLDVRDYSDSESSDDQSNVGWTYYNKVMTHVNGMLQDSDMLSSASALYRNTRKQCVQMQIDKTNVSVTKRVKFGDDPLGVHQPHIYAANTDTSLKMNQLAAKYRIPAPAPKQVPKPIAAPTDMSFATRNYMEKHKILQGLPLASRSPPPGEMPRFLDITALKQQTKLL